ncbi:reverse transcriptase domain-containing protein [Kitasatospora sp. NPDC001159]
MSSGTYFPPPVRAVEIPKPGGKRMLGVPTVADRIAQTVVALALEPRTESIFHDDSYGYRPKRSALQAVERCRQRCWKKDWVIDLDVQKFFDSVDHAHHVVTSPRDPPDSPGPSVPRPGGPWPGRARGRARPRRRTARRGARPSPPSWCPRRR